MPKILIVEDEESILMALEDDLSLEGFAVTGETDGAWGLERAKQGGYDLIILDIMLPGMDGFEICKRLRAEGNTTPIMMLTAKSQEVDKVVGLELGADDYVTKPFSPRELLARVVRRRRGRLQRLRGAKSR
jgi:DNA-binding response OmpR family regulator